MSDSVVLVSLIEADAGGQIGQITINRPKAMNAINKDILVALDTELGRFEAMRYLRAVVLCGAGERAFVAGADIAEMSDFQPLQAEFFAGLGQAIFERLSRLPCPTIAAVNGFALGGGCELAMSCDIVLAGTKAKFGQPEVKLGVIPGFGGTQRLVRRVGVAKALDLCLTARLVGAEEAVTMGLASRIVVGDVLSEAILVAQTIASMGPVATRLCKRAILENSDNDCASAQAAERSLFALCFASADQKEGMQAFLERRPASFTGR